MPNIKSLPKVDKYSDFVAYMTKNPDAKPAELSKTYHVSKSAIYAWIKKLKGGESNKRN